MAHLVLQSIIASTLPHWLTYQRTHKSSLHDISLSKSGHCSSGDDEECGEKEDGVGCDTLSKYQDWVSLCIVMS